MSIISVGGISLAAPEHWIFYPFENLVLAHTDAKLGTLQISLAFRHRAPAGSTHEHCLAVALDFTDVESRDLFDHEAFGDGERLFGVASFPCDEKLGRVFYTRDDHGLIVAVYRSTQPEAETELSECAQILRDASFS